MQESKALEEVKTMAHDLETSFQELTGLSTKKGFKPHLTILKLSKDSKLRRKVQYKPLIAFNFDDLS
jgi:2'-5' RNA ligase